MEWKDLEALEIACPCQPQYWGQYTDPGTGKRHEIQLCHNKHLARTAFWDYLREEIGVKPKEVSAELVLRWPRCQHLADYDHDLQYDEWILLLEDASEEFRELPPPTQPVHLIGKDNLTEVYRHRAEQGQGIFHHGDRINQHRILEGVGVLVERLRNGTVKELGLKKKGTD